MSEASRFRTRRMRISPSPSTGSSIFSRNAISRSTVSSSTAKDHAIRALVAPDLEVAIGEAAAVELHLDHLLDVDDVAVAQHTLAQRPLLDPVELVGDGRQPRDRPLRATGDHAVRLAHGHQRDTRSRERLQHVHDRRKARLLERDQGRDEQIRFAPRRRDERRFTDRLGHPRDPPLIDGRRQQRIPEHMERRAENLPGLVRGHRPLRDERHDPAHLLVEEDRAPGLLRDQLDQLPDLHPLLVQQDARIGRGFCARCQAHAHAHMKREERGEDRPTGGAWNAKGGAARGKAIRASRAPLCEDRVRGAAEARHRQGLGNSKTRTRMATRTSWTSRS